MSTKLLAQYVFTFAILIWGVGFAVWWECYGTKATIQLPPVEKNYPREYIHTYICVWMRAHVCACLSVCACVCMCLYHSAEYA